MYVFDRYKETKIIMIYVTLIDGHIQNHNFDHLYLCFYDIWCSTLICYFCILYTFNHFLFVVDVILTSYWCVKSCKHYHAKKKSKLLKDTWLKILCVYITWKNIVDLIWCHIFSVVMRIQGTSTMHRKEQTFRSCGCATFRLYALHN